MNTRRIATGPGGSAWVARASRPLVSASRRNELSSASNRAHRCGVTARSSRWRDAIAIGRDARATQNLARDPRATVHPARQVAARVFGTQECLTFSQDVIYHLDGSN